MHARNFDRGNPEVLAYLSYHLVEPAPAEWMPGSCVRKVDGIKYFSPVIVKGAEMHGFTFYSTGVFCCNAVPNNVHRLVNFISQVARLNGVRLRITYKVKGIA